MKEAVFSYRKQPLCLKTKYNGNSRKYFVLRPDVGHAPQGQGQSGGHEEHADDVEDRRAARPAGRPRAAWLARCRPWTEPQRGENIILLIIYWYRLEYLCFDKIFF